MKVTTDIILNWLKKNVESKIPIDPHQWIEVCQKLNILIGDENSKLYDLQQGVSKLKIERIEKGDTVSKAQIYVEATDEYKEMKKQHARVEQIQEAIRISKIQARLANDEIKGY